MDRRTRNLLLTVQLCFGVFPWLGKEALAAFSPRALLVWRLLVGGGVLLAAAALRHRRAALPGAADLLRLAGLSLLGVILNQLLYLEGLALSTAVNAGLLMTVIPVATTALAVALGHETLTLRRQLGIGLSVAGVALLFVRRGAQVSAATLRGDLYLVLNAVSYSCFLVLAKPVLARLPRLVVVAWVFAFGALTVPWFSLDVAWVPAAAQARHWAALAAILVFPTVLAYVLNAVVLARVPASTTAVWITLQPIVAAALAIPLLGERPGPGVALAAAGVLSGLWLVSRPARAPA